MLTIEQVRPFYQGADAVHDFDHVLRVLSLAERIGQAEGANLTVIRAAALLHDIARNDEAPEGQDHAERAAEWAREILDGEPALFVEAVVEAIAAHRFRRGPAPASLEARILFDADKLDAIGAMGVARAFAYGALHSQRLWADLPPDLPGAPEDGPEGYTPVHEYLVKLRWLKDRMYTATGRKLAERRHAYMTGFFEQLDREVRGEL